MISGAGLARRVMVDASHGNSGKDYRRQPAVAGVLAGQIGGGEQGIVGIMLESFLQPGRQEPGDPATLVYGQSVTDACIDVDATAGVLGGLAAAVRPGAGPRRAGRRAASAATGRATVLTGPAS